MSNKLLVDTNILIYAHLPNEHFHAVAKNKIEELSSEFELIITRQIIREFLKVKSLIMYQNNKFDSKELIRDADFFEDNFTILDEDKNTTDNLLHLIDAFQVKGNQIHDCNIVASMLENQVFKIFTHNVKDFKRYEPLIQIIPLFDNEIEHSIHVIGLKP